MNTTIRGLKGLLALGALAGLGLLLRWVTTGSIDAATAQDLTSMASLAIGAVAWVAYCWFVVAVLATVLEQAPGAVGRGASVVAARITSQGSRALLRSALGVAAVTPLTIGVAHATPGNGSHTFTEPRTTIQLTGNSTAGSRPWPSVKPRTTIQVTGNSTAGSRPWTSVEPRSTVEITGSTLAGSPRSGSAADWRATEKPSSIELTAQGSSKLPATSTRMGKPAKQTPAGRIGAPAKAPVGQIAVPDRPTTGAPTRYTHLQSGQLARAASHVVKHDDSLWSIATAELGPNATDEAIAARWPQWYAANRQLIGPDPNLIHPGQVLNPPAPSHPVPPTHQEK
jgi:hypothetical protein